MPIAIYLLAGVESIWDQGDAPSSPLPCWRLER